MQRNLLIEARKYIQSNRRHRVWQKVVRVIAGCVVFCTTYALILPAITMEQEAFCGHEEHTHSEECYVQTSHSLKLNCSPNELELHVHSEDCLDAEGNTVCGLADYVVHTHTADCVDKNGVVVCVFPEAGQHIHDSGCYSIPETTAQSHTHSDSCYSKEKSELICTTAQQEVHTHTETCYATEKEQICTAAESAGHVHSDGCYTTETVKTCTVEESVGHTHAEECFITENNQTCTTPESVGHTHASECYDAEGALVCITPESAGHTHGDGCYTAQQKLICGQAEQAGHSHGDGCYTAQKNLTCGQAEQEAHTHGDSCYETPIICGLIETEGHAHTDACYSWNETVICGLEETPIPEPELICTTPIAEVHVHSADCFEIEEEPLICQLEESEEHTHTALCYGTWELSCPMEEHTHELICFSDPEADLETAQVWERTFANVQLTGIWADDVLAIAKTQIGYTESTRNYAVWEDGTTHGYTRYGDWYGSPYGDWCAMFVSFCIHYAEIDGVPLNWGCRTWIEELSKEELDLYREAGEYEPKPGDIIFFDWEEADGTSDDLADHVGLVAELIPATEIEPTKIKTIEGNSSNQVKYNTYDADDTEILGYGIMPENPELEVEVVEVEETEIVTALYTYSDDTLYVEVELPGDTSVPADAVLTVTPIASDDEGYDDYVAQAEAALDGTVANIALYDISFYTADGTYIPVSDTANVTMGFTESPVDTDAEIHVLHFEAEAAAPQVIKGVDFAEKEIEMILSDVQQVSEPTEAVLQQESRISLYTEAPPMEGNPAAEEAAAQPETGIETEEEGKTDLSVETITETRTVIQFTTNGFSIFAMVEVQAGNQNAAANDIANLDGKSIIIAGVNYDGAGNPPVMTSIPFAIADDGDGPGENNTKPGFGYRTSGGITQNGNNAASITLDNTNDAIWVFTAVANQNNTYYIQPLDSNQYLNIADNSLTLGAQQAITVEQATGETNIQNAVCLGNGGYYVNLCKNTSQRPFTGYGGGTGNTGNHLALFEYITENVPVTNLDGRALAIVNPGANQAVTSTVNNNMLSGLGITWTNDVDPTIDISDEQKSNVYWIFEAVNAQNGVYNIKSSNEQYLNIRNGTASLGDAQDITVTQNADGHVLLSAGGQSLRVNAGVFAGSDNVDEGSHFVLAENTAVANIVDKINELLSRLEQNEDGSWSFSDEGYTGSAAPNNENIGQQGNDSENGNQAFIDAYDKAQNYRREVQELAREIRDLYAKLPEEDQRYVSRYEIVDSGGENKNDLKWLWDTVGTVTSNDPIGVKVELFNYDESVNNTGLAYGRGAEGTDAYNDPKGFTFYHKKQYDEYTQVDQGRDEIRGGVLGSDDSVLNMQTTLENGYPYVTGGAGGEYTEGKGSLQYLFDPAGVYHVASMNNGGGLFRKDSEGFYYYYANQNAAWFNGTDFTLYDTVIRPMYIHGAHPKSLNDAYNFLPFNNPYDDLIFDEPGTLTSNNSLTGYGDGSEHAANTTKTGYLNERSDMWFGMTMEFSFLKANNGQIDILDANGQPTGNKVDMTFDFYGDDDVWVYIDNQLVLDIGGVHGAEKGSINFRTGDVSYQDGARGTTNTTIADIFEGVNGAQITGNTFTDGTPHTLKFFYMERGGNVSYCGLKFNMPALPENYLLVQKTRDDGTAEVIGDTYHTFRVVQADKDGNALDANGTTTTDPTQMVPYFEANTPFDIYYYGGVTDTKTDGIVDENGYFTIKSGYAAMFTNVLKYRRNDSCVHFKVQEVLQNTETGQYQYLDYTLVTEQSNSTTEEKKQDFTPYDYDALENYYFKGGSYTFTNGLDANDKNTLSLTNVTNTEKLGKLSVTKELAEGSTTSEDTPFTIKVELGSWAIVEKDDATSQQVVYEPIPTGTKYTIGGEGYTVTSSDGTITLKSGETAVFDGFLAGTYYRVTEVLGVNDNFNPWFDYGLVDADGTPVSVTTGTAPEFNEDIYGVEGEMGLGDSAWVKITNSDYDASVEIPITKNVSHAGDAVTFTFNVVQGTVSDGIWTETENSNIPGTTITVAENALSGEEIVTIGISSEDMTDDKATFYYLISEANTGGNFIYDDTQYVVEVTATKSDTTLTAEVTKIYKLTGSVLQEVTPTPSMLSFTNTRTTSIILKKDMADGSTGKAFTFNVSYKLDGETTSLGTYTVNSGSETTISGIPVGAEVNVTETGIEGKYKPAYRVYSRYEAEKAENVGTNNNGTYVGNIGGGTKGSVTFQVNMLEAASKDMQVRYGTWSNRDFAIQVNGTPQTLSCIGDGASWEPNRITTLEIGLQAGVNTITFGGNDADNPNLDYIEFEWRAADEASATHTVGDVTTFHFTNTTLYELPMTGGSGTNLYTLGGWLLTTVSIGILLYIQRKRRKEDTAPF